MLGPETVRRSFERLFERQGLPKAIRSDNGCPRQCVRLLGLNRALDLVRSTGN